MNRLNNLLVEGGAGAGTEVRARETAKEGVGVLLPSVRAPSKPLASSFLPPGGGLRQEMRQVRGPALTWS